MPQKESPWKVYATSSHLWSRNTNTKNKGSKQDLVESEGAMVRRILDVSLKERTANIAKYLPLLTYAGQTVSLTKKVVNKIRVNQRAMVHWIFGDS